MYLGALPPYALQQRINCTPAPEYASLICLWWLCLAFCLPWHECIIAACLLLTLSCVVMTRCTQVTIRWHEADLRVRASLTLPVAKDENAMASMLKVVWNSLEITQVLSCLCVCPAGLRCLAWPASQMSEIFVYKSSQQDVRKLELH